MDEILASASGWMLGQSIEIEKTMGVADLGIKLKKGLFWPCQVGAAMR